MNDRIIEFECNIDDMTAEEIAYAAERLMEAGARDVAITPIVMKKGRPAYMLTVMIPDRSAKARDASDERGPAAEDDPERRRMIELIFRYTTTIGIREVISERYILDRREVVAETPYGDVRCKVVSGYGTERRKFEYEDLARIAREQDISIAEARRLVVSATGGEL